MMSKIEAFPSFLLTHFNKSRDFAIFTFWKETLFAYTILEVLQIEVLSKYCTCYKFFKHPKKRDIGCFLLITAPWKKFFSFFELKKRFSVDS